jgi:hypothetical protein
MLHRDNLAGLCPIRAFIQVPMRPVNHALGESLDFVLGNPKFDKGMT